MSQNPQSSSSLPPFEYPTLNPQQPSESQQTSNQSPFSSVDHERDVLYRSIFALGTNMDSFVRHQTESTAATNAVLNAMMERLTLSRPAVASSSVPKFREPRKFNGKADEVEPFLREIRYALNLQANAFSTKLAKCQYFALYLADGTPTSWYTTVERSPEKRGLLDNFELLVKDFIEHFNEPDRYAKALRKLRKLRQTGSAADYTSRFLKLVSELNWTDQTKIQHYFNGLKDTVQDTLVNRKGRYFTEKFVEFYKLCIVIDNELHELSLNCRANSSFVPKRNSFSNHSIITPPQHASTSSNPDVVPMEVDAMRRGITSEERQRRLNEHLCLYCGQGQHLAANCPNKSAKAKSKEKRKAAPSSGKA